MTVMPHQGSGLVVWLDNLFANPRLIITLRDFGIGAAKTVRTTKTSGEEDVAERITEFDPGY